MKRKLISLLCVLLGTLGLICFVITDGTQFITFILSITIIVVGLFNTLPPSDNNTNKPVT